MVYHVQFPGLGLDLTINRVALAIGGFNIYWYGVIIAAGMLLAMLYAFRNAVDYGIDSDRLVDVVAIGTVMAIVCARIYYVAMAPFEYQSLWDMIDIRKLFKEPEYYRDIRRPSVQTRRCPGACTARVRRHISNPCRSRCPRA